MISVQPMHDTRIQPIGQQALGTIRLRLMIEDMMTYVTFHVIDAITSTNVLLGRPWLHEHKVVPSTWYQCFKYKTPEGETNMIFPSSFSFLLRVGLRASERNASYSTLSFTFSLVPSDVL